MLAQHPASLLVQRLSGHRSDLVLGEVGPVVQHESSGTRANGSLSESLGQARPELSQWIWCSVSVTRSPVGEA
nr:hypothetical protein [Gammaproteobacteria bacterium]